jgi:hypothetical protein
VRTAVGDQLADQLEERPPQSRREVDRAESRKRDHGDAVRRADLPRDGPAADSQRKIGDDDAEVPALIQQFAPRRLDDFGRLSRRCDQALDSKLGLPLDAQVQRVEVVRELARDLGGQVARETRCDDHAEGNEGLRLLTMRC